MDARNFLFVSADAALVTDLVWQVHRKGHGVKYYIEAECDREIGDGFVPRPTTGRQNSNGPTSSFSTTSGSATTSAPVNWRGSFGNGATPSSAGRRTRIGSRETAATRWTGVRVRSYRGDDGRR